MHGGIAAMFPRKLLPLSKNIRAESARLNQNLTMSKLSLDEILI